MALHYFNLLLKTIARPKAGLWLLFWFWGCSLSLAQQTISDLENWNPGYLVTREEDTLYGPIIVNYANDLVQINEENKVKTYGPNQVAMVYVKENDSQNERYFYSFRFHPYSDFKPFKIFEMLFSGKALCLLSRETLVTETVPTYDNFTYRTYYTTRTRLSHEFYFLFPGEKVRAYNGSKKELLNLLADKKEELKKYISTNRLNPGEKEDLMKIVLEYNKLKKDK